MVFYVRTGESFEDDKRILFRDNNNNYFSRDTVITVEKEPRSNFGLKMQIDYLPALQQIDFESSDEDVLITDFEPPVNMIKFIK